MENNKDCKNENVYQCKQCERGTWLFEDYDRGCIVCMNCGLVFSDQIFSYYNSRSCSTAFTNSVKTIKTTTLQQSLNLVAEICDKFNLTFEVSKTAAYFINQNEKTLKSQTLRAWSAFWTYKSLLQHSVIRSKDEICFMFKCSRQLFNDMINEFDKSAVQIDETCPSDILPRINFNFNMPYKLKCKIGNMADNLFQHTNAGIRTTLGYVIYKTVNLHKHNLGVKKFTYEDAGKLVHASSGSIKRFKKNNVKH